jgi:hypothetical protein
LVRVHQGEEKIVLEVVYQGNLFKKQLKNMICQVPTRYRCGSGNIKNGMIVLPPMTEQQKADLKASEQRIKELEKALEYANVVIFSLNHLIDFAEKELQVPIRKKGGTKQ